MSTHEAAQTLTLTQLMGHMLYTGILGTTWFPQALQGLHPPPEQQQQK